MDVARKLMRNGDLGQIEFVFSGFSQNKLDMRCLFTPGGGNPIFDMGIYPIALSQQFLGNPSEIKVFGKLKSDGVYEEAHVFMRLVGGARSNFVLSARTVLPHWAGVLGTGRNFFWNFLVHPNIYHLQFH